MSKKQTLAELAKQTQPNRTGNLNFFDKLSPEKKAEYAEMKRAFHAKELGQHGLSSLHRLCQETQGLKVELCAFSTWMKSLDKPS